MSEQEKQKDNNGKAGAPADVNNFEEKLTQCEKTRDEYLAGWQRAKADFINYKKEEMERLREMAQYGNEDVLRDVIVVLDSFDLAVRAMEKLGDVDNGIYMIRTQLEDILRKRGAERLEVKIGEQLDPSTTEAVAQVESDESPGTVLEEIEAGWKLHDKILRPARVKVSKQKQAAP